MYTYALIGSLIGFVVGVIVVTVITLIKRSNVSGTIFVVSDIDGTYFSLSIRHLEDITTKKKVYLNVVSQK